MFLMWNDLVSFAEANPQETSLWEKFKVLLTEEYTTEIVQSFLDTWMMLPTKSSLHARTERTTFRVPRPPFRSCPILPRQGSRA